MLLCLKINAHIVVSLSVKNFFCPTQVYSFLIYLGIKDNE